MRGLLCSLVVSRVSLGVGGSGLPAAQPGVCFWAGVLGGGVQWGPNLGFSEYFFISYDFKS